MEQTKAGESYLTKMNEVYGRVNEFINGEKYDPSEAAAGGSPGGGTDLSSLTVEERQALADKAAQDYNAKYNSYRKAIDAGYVGAEKHRMEVRNLRIQNMYMKKMDINVY